MLLYVVACNTNIEGIKLKVYITIKGSCVRGKLTVLTKMQHRELAAVNSIILVRMYILDKI